MIKKIEKLKKNKASLLDAKAKLKGKEANLKTIVEYNYMLMILTYLKEKGWAIVKRESSLHSSFFHLRRDSEAVNITFKAKRDSHKYDNDVTVFFTVSGDNHQAKSLTMNATHLLYTDEGQDNSIALGVIENVMVVLATKVNSNQKEG